ncbi:tricarboxylic transport [Agrobacterium salinitolerans]|uniref:tripartite tricarboxylate transporter TctB family protein n=1 Tax=Agrobacterium salinitolerans TaxID=1183413 RepID=UPI00098FAF51|nr:tripartite tricarboxylate transporter TctB family protein [Agrobacterium salinitolerans]NTA39159.1 tripartite tricarboxylate transporter TctB family protein [Agrobacterium salinitolerans]OOO23042.1 tricarboxylic transport [Agrobacterium salinitolerans]PNQ23327.1 tripartite tricarboxylate transporter TctB family protein [Rhizobium sp. YIC5082]
MSEARNTEPRNARLIGRVSAVILLLLAIAYGFGGSVIDYAFASDPLGPRVFPVALAFILGALAIVYYLSPGSVEGFPDGPLLIRVLAIPALVLIAALLFEPAGFFVSILVLTFGSGLLFGAPLKTALAGAVGHALLWWFVFDFLLEVYLPVGSMFGG